jgi:hypothetical protein
MSSSGLSPDIVIRLLWLSSMMSVYVAISPCLPSGEVISNCCHLDVSPDVVNRLWWSSVVGLSSGVCHLVRSARYVFILVVIWCHLVLLTYDVVICVIFLFT